MQTSTSTMNANLVALGGVADVAAKMCSVPKSNDTKTYLHWTCRGAVGFIDFTVSLFKNFKFLIVVTTFPEINLILRGSGLFLSIEGRFNILGIYL